MKFNIGDRVRLRTSVRDSLHVRLDQKDHDDAYVVGVEPLIAADCVVLSRELMGIEYWRESQLALVKKVHDVNHSEIVLKFSKQQLPVARRQLYIKGKSPSNIDMGFSPEQAMALDALEDAIADNEHPCIGHDRRRQCRARVVACYNVVQKLGLRPALTDRELDEVKFCFLDNTVLK